jgi:hypothetical protein
MPIVVFWIDDPGAAGHREFADGELLDALKFTEQMRAGGKRHVTISSELAHSVGKPGVDEVAAGQLPGGDAYEFNKRHRGSGPGSGS